MKIEYIFSIIAIGAFYITSCSSDQKSFNEDIKIDYKQDEIFNWKNCLHIEKTILFRDSIILGFAKNCFVTEDRIIYHDYNQHNVLLFDINGHLISILDGLGQGSQEYGEIIDLNLSYNHKSLQILDNASILEFSTTDGKFMSRQYLDFKDQGSLRKFVNIGEKDYYFWATHSDNSLYRYTDNKFHEFFKRNGFHFESQKFYEYPKGCINYISDYGNTLIYSIKNDSITNKYKFYFGNYSLPKSKIPNDYKDFESIEKEPYFKNILHAYETDKWLFVQTVSPNMDLYNIIYNKDNGSILSGKQDKDFPIAIVGTYQQLFVGIVYPAYFTDKSFINILLEENNYHDSDNPIIILFNLKI